VHAQWDITTLDAPSRTAARCGRGGPLILLLALLVLAGPITAQVGVTTFGLEAKPVLPLSFFDPVTELQREHLKGSIELTGGFAFGMLVRHGLSRSLSLETGIAQITRRYDSFLRNDTNGYEGGSPVRWVGYEVPITALVFIRLGERTFMNTALGFSLDMYPSDAVKVFDNGRVYMFRNRWAQGGIVGNLGFEHRTAKAGIFYLGATYHRPFGPMSTVDLTYSGADLFPYTMRTELSGSYLTVDIRYFFHEAPDRTRVRRSGE
jgi:hypothetical protein